MTPRLWLVVVTGSVGWTNAEVIEESLRELATRKSASEGSLRVITGMASGADEIARTWAADHAKNGVSLFAEPLKPGPYPHPMHSYNHKMLAMKPNLVLAFKEQFDDRWAMPSCLAGTEHMCRIAADAGIAVLLNGSVVLAGDAQPLG